jgi:hypothetical protein
MRTLGRGLAESSSPSTSTAGQGLVERSLVADHVREVGVAGSNPATPANTYRKSQLSSPHLVACRCCPDTFCCVSVSAGSHPGRAQERERAAIGRYMNRPLAIGLLALSRRLAACSCKRTRRGSRKPSRRGCSPCKKRRAHLGADARRRSRPRAGTHFFTRERGSKNFFCARQNRFSGERLQNLSACCA